MYDIWDFLLQTLTVSGSAALILVLKAIFRDKLPPKWHFGVWGVFAFSALIPAGISGRYTLFNWRVLIELVKPLFGEYAYTRVTLPFPIPRLDMPETAAEWIFDLYMLGAFLHAAAYVFSYVRLATTVRRAAEDVGLSAQTARVADKYGLKVCRTVAAEGAPSAFLCGIFHPTLVLPAGANTDDKVILHELIHFRNRDTSVSAAACILRCIHWCNPFVTYCLDRAVNDMEARCDQMVLELLEGEERRDYGRILLDMTNEKYDRTPGSTSMNNGGKNIRRRIESIVRFKKYPAGMALVSVCIMIPLALYLSVGSAAYAAHHSENLYLSLASARSTVCTTYAGAFDAYAKAVIYENGAYRAMCLPEDGQEALALSMRENERSGIYPLWDDGLSVLADRSEGYYIYNIERVGENAYEATLALSVSGTPEREYPGINEICVATQRICAYKENGRWVVSALGSFEFNMSADRNLGWGCEAISGKLYVGEANNMRAELVVQTVNVSGIEAKGGVPVPDAKFEDTRYTHRFYLYHTGTQEERDGISQVGVSLAPVYEGEGRPELPAAAHGDFSSSNTGGGFRISSLKKAGWGPSALRGGGGSGFYGDVYGYKYPHMYAADLYINAEIVGAIDMYPTEGGKND